MPGTYKGKPADVVTVFEAIGAYRAGKITLDELYEAENGACPGAGACGGQFTANTMSTVMEFLGLSPAGLNGIPAEDPKKDEAARRAGELVMTLVHHDIRPLAHRHPATSLENAIASVSATGGSTNAVLHMPAIAAEFGIPLTLDDFAAVVDRTPLIADMRPGGRYAAAGHVRGRRRRPRHARAAQARPAPRRREDRGRAHDREDRRRRRRDAGPAGRPPDRDPDQADRRPRDPARQPGARRARIVKLAGHERRHHRGPARVFDSENACFDAVQRAPDPRGRRRRHPLRGPGRRARACRRCSASRARSSARAWASTSRCSRTAGSPAAPTA